MSTSRRRSRTTERPSAPGDGSSGRERAARAVPGLRALRRPASDSAPAFDLAYVRRTPGAGSGAVVLEIPGGPGMAMPLPYRSFRDDAAERGLDVIMVEHRGVGLSRTDIDGRDLPRAAMSVPAVVEDLVAVLDAEGVDRAIVSGASYGSYVAAAFAVTHPERTAALVLDSTLLGAGDSEDVRAASRARLWDGRDPRTAELARRIRILVERDGHDELALGEIVTTVYEFGGERLLERYLDRRVVGRTALTDAALHRLLRQETARTMPHLMEMDLVAQIAYGELDYAPEPDARIFDPAHTLAMDDAPPFTGEHYDLARELQAVDVPAVVISGDRDLRTPRPVAERAAAALPDAVLLEVPGHGHSALDTRPGLLLDVLEALSRGEHRELPARARELARRSRPVASGRVLPVLVRLLLGADRILRPVPAVPRGLR